MGCAVVDPCVGASSRYTGPVAESFTGMSTVTIAFAEAHTRDVTDAPPNMSITFQHWLTDAGLTLNSTVVGV